MKRNRHAAETSSHPFRSLFDLMLALVLLLLAAFVLRQPKPRTEYDTKAQIQELLLLHNLKIRKEKGENALLLTNLNQTPSDDICRKLLSGVALKEADRQELEAHRSALWQEVAPTVRKRLLAQQITRIKIDQDALRFPTGSAVPVNTAQLPQIFARVVALSQGAKSIRVEGHTDSQPMFSAQFPSNWELSSARAIWLAKQLQPYLNAHHISTGRGGVQIEAIGYADTRPVHDNLTEAHRAENRRIEIVFER